MKTTTVNDIDYKIGQNAQENWDLLNLDENYTWFHLKSFPSCHVIIEKIEPNYDEILEVESYKIISSKKSPILFQGFHENIIKSEIILENKLFKKGTFIVPMNQRRSNLAVETLEPEMLSGFLRFNVIEPESINKIHRYLQNKQL